MKENDFKRSLLTLGIPKQGNAIIEFRSRKPCTETNGFGEREGGNFAARIYLTKRQYKKRNI